MKKLDLSNLNRPEAYQTKISRIVRQQAHKIADTIDGKKIDIGCGNGIFLMERHLKSGGSRRIFGLDHDLYALRNARTLCIDNKIDPNLFICGDAYRLPLPSNFFDGVFCLNTLINLHPFSRIELLIRELHRICKPGGKIAFDYRNALNPILKLKYIRNHIRGNLTTHGHRQSQFKALIAELDIKTTRSTALGIKNRFLSVGYLTVWEK